jgi:hypothetical protein
VDLEPAFRAHNLELTFRNSLGHRRLCRFSFSDEAILSEFARALDLQSANTKSIKGQDSWTRALLPDRGSLSPELSRAIDYMALKTLSDCLMASSLPRLGNDLEEDLEATPKAFKPLASWTMSSAQADYNAQEIQRVMAADLPLHGTPTKKARTDPGRAATSHKTTLLTGNEIVLMCRQNSLIPIIFGLPEEDQLAVGLRSTHRISNQQHETQTTRS